MRSINKRSTRVVATFKKVLRELSNWIQGHAYKPDTKVSLWSSRRKFEDKLPIDSDRERMITWKKLTGLWPATSWSQAVHSTIMLQLTKECFFCSTPKPRTYLNPNIWAECGNQMAQVGFFPNSSAAACFEPMLVELHQTGTFKGRSTNWATAPLPDEGMLKIISC